MSIVCGKPGVKITAYERHLIRMFGKFLEDPRKVTKRCPWCFHKWKKHGKCKVCKCKA